jgi:hypothetical protein
MNDVNELWSSAWRRLQKNLAGSFAAGGSNACESAFASSVQGKGISASGSWLMRARCAEQATRIQ